MLFAGIFLIALFLLGIMVFRMKAFGRIPRGEDLERIQKSHHYNGRKFVNAFPTPITFKVREVYKDYRKNRKNQKKPVHPVPVQKLTENDFGTIPSDSLRVIWLGHSGVLIELEGVRILADPVLSRRASPFSRVGVKKQHESPLEIADIPEVQVVLISHNHYDHLDYQTIISRVGKNVQYCVPLGVGATLRYWGISSDHIREFDWHERCFFQKIEIIALPARHFSGRRFRDRDRTLWCSWMVKGQRQSFFHSGDSGYFKGYEDIGKGYGPFDLSMIGIGAYNELWASIHTFPEEAVEAHINLNAQKLLPLHWATFKLAFHGYYEPVQRLVKEANERNIALILPEIGEWVHVADYKLKKYWWIPENKRNRQNY